MDGENAIRTTRFRIGCAAFSQWYRRNESHRPEPVTSNNRAAETFLRAHTGERRLRDIRADVMTTAQAIRYNHGL